ncbi:MAG: endonuclease domain-containing protein [Balneolaceae bacterium]|nr:endonuclease domain-containing protein [Balneolaceae bacterium]
MNKVKKNSPPAEGCPPVPELVEGGGRGGELLNEVNERSSKNYFALPYNPALKERARALRKAGNLPEVLLWKQLKKPPFDHLDFDRQKIIGNYIVDFYCTNLNLVIEVDGESHDSKVEYDKRRDEYLMSLGLKIIHIRAKEVLQNMEGVIRY